MVPKPVKRKPEDELPLQNIAVKKAKASSAVAGDLGDDDKLGYSDAEITSQDLRTRWMEDSIRLSSGGLSEVSGKDLVQEAEEVEQGENDTNEGHESYLNSKIHFNGQSIGIPRESKQTWESNEFFDPNLDIYPLNAAVQLQNDLENLESELVIRDRIPWESFKPQLCRRCKVTVDKHLLAVLQANRRWPEHSVSDKRDEETRPSLGTRGGFDYFLGLPTLEELANKQRDIETLRMLLPIRQDFALENLEPKLCKNCDEYLRTSGRLPAKAVATAPVTSHSKKITISSDPEDSLVHVSAEHSKQKPNVEKPAPASGPEGRPPVPMGPPKFMQPRALRPAHGKVPEVSQPPVPIDPPQKVPPNIAPPKQVSTKKAPTSQQFAPDEPQPSARDDRPKREGSASESVASDEPQPAAQADRPKTGERVPKGVAPKEPQLPGPEKPKTPTQVERPKMEGLPAEVVAPKESQPPTRAERPKRGTAPKAVAPKKSQSPVQNERPKSERPAPNVVAPGEPQPPVQNERPIREGRATKLVARGEPQPPAPDGKPKKEDPIPSPIAPKEAEPIQLTATEKTRKKSGRAGKPNISNSPSASPKPATQEVDKAEDGIEEAGPIQRVMGNLPEKPKGHDYYCAICYTNLTRMSSAKKLEHMEKCGTTLGEVKVMTKAQAQAEKTAK